MDFIMIERSGLNDGKNKKPIIKTDESRNLSLCDISADDITPASEHTDTGAKKKDIMRKISKICRFTKKR